MSRDEGPRTKGACRFYGMVQNKLKEDLLHSIVKGAVEAESMSKRRARRSSQPLATGLQGNNMRMSFSS